MKVRALLAALYKAKNKDAEVDIISEQGDELSFDEGFYVDEDADGEAVHIVVMNPPKL